MLLYQQADLSFLFINSSPLALIFLLHCYRVVLVFFLVVGLLNNKSAPELIQGIRLNRFYNVIYLVLFKNVFFFIFTFLKMSCWPILEAF